MKKLFFLSLIIFSVFFQQCKKTPTTPEIPTLPTINSFTASSSAITCGELSTLSWNVSDATSVDIDQGIGSVPSSGSRDVSPTKITTYTLTARNDDGQSTKNCTVTVSVAPIKTGEWAATAEGNSFANTFTVSSDSSYITVSSNGNSIPMITYIFANIRWGGVRLNGTIIKSSNPGWPISDRSFVITNTLKDNQVELTIRGTFSDSGDQVSGTFTASIGTVMPSGSWKGSAKN